MDSKIVNGLVAGVLILVLVDVGLGHHDGDTMSLLPICLNPCFSGCWSRTLLINPVLILRRSSS